MLIVLAFVFGALLGTGAHFVVGGRGLRGAAVGPMLGTFLGGLAWLGMTWAGQSPDTAWPWVASVVLPAAVVPVALLILTRTRTRADARTRARLGI